MGSWTELDANYPEGALTPGAAFVVALGHLEGAASVYAGGSPGRLADFFPRAGRGLVADQDLLSRAERYLRAVPIDDFLAEVRAILNPQQMLCLLLNLLDAVLAEGWQPEQHPRYGRIVAGLGETAGQIQPYVLALRLKNDLSIFPQ